ncbi:MAG: hypothetical protein ACRDOH_06965 [Streptosporangiaceae bacterium]
MDRFVDRAAFAAVSSCYGDMACNGRPFTEHPNVPTLRVDPAAARLGHSGGGATTLRHYADPVSEVDRRAAAYLAQLTAGPAS